MNIKLKINLFDPSYIILQLVDTYGKLWHSFQPFHIVDNIYITFHVEIK